MRILFQRVLSSQSGLLGGNKMKKLALHVAAFSVLLVGTASAADLRRPMPVKAPAPAPVAVYNWTGCYVGAGGGYGMFNQESQYIDNGTVFGLSNDNGGRGWFGTVQVGCDYQIGSNIVIGAFGDYDWSGIKGDMSIAALGSDRRREAEELMGSGRSNRLASVPAAPGIRVRRLHPGTV